MTKKENWLYYNQSTLCRGVIPLRARHLYNRGLHNCRDKSIFFISFFVWKWKLFNKNCLNSSKHKKAERLRGTIYGLLISEPIEKKQPPTWRSGASPTMNFTASQCKFLFYLLTLYGMNKTKQKFYLWTAKMITIFTFACLMFNESSRDWIMNRQSHFIPKITFIFFAVVFIDRYWAEIKNLIRKLRDFERTKLAFQIWDFHTIDGIPARKLLHILQTTNGLLYKTFVQEIASDRQLYDKISSNLEKAGVLIRGDKNAKILNSLFNDDQIYKILTSATDSDNLSPALLQVWPNSYEFIKAG